MKCPGQDSRYWKPGAIFEEKCPECGIEWRLSWPYPKTAKVRGPVWESYPAPADEKTFLGVWNS